LNCLWNFGDGETSSDCTPSHVFTNCGVHKVLVAVGDGISSVTGGVTVAVTCPMSINSLKLQAKFKRTGADTCAIKGSLTEVPPAFSVANGTVALYVGDAQLEFQLNAKGKGVSGNGSITFSRNKKTGTWIFTGKLKGDMKSAWAKYGLTNAIMVNEDVTFPLLLTIQSDSLHAFDAEPQLSYSNRSGTSGTGKCICP
jgi:hypothetical protein